MHRVSTNLTLFYKFFIPTFWIIFFGAFTTAILLLNRPFYGSIPGPTFRTGAVIFFLSGVIVLFFTLMRLKRVEVDETYLYVTNYFKTFRYPYHQVEKMEESNFLFLKIVGITFKNSGAFGKRVTFIASQSKYREFWDKHPGLRSKLLDGGG